MPLQKLTGNSSTFNHANICFGNKVFVNINMTAAKENFRELFQLSVFDESFLRIEKCTANFGTDKESVVLIENQCPTNLDIVKFVSYNQHEIEFEMINFRGRNSTRFQLYCDLCKSCNRKLFFTQIFKVYSFNLATCQNCGIQKPCCRTSNQTNSDQNENSQE